jgi:murein DD-endopeptidase MepM/ murein hydrolase activator NlpD
MAPTSTAVKTVSTTGWSTGCHTHFTVLQDGTAVDPMTYIGGNI